MAISRDKIADLRAKELEMLQAVIARLANYGATLKNYCATLTTASAGVALTLQRPAAIFLALFPILICAVLDAQYLRNERRFRRLYHNFRKQDWATMPTFNITLSGAPHEKYLSAFFSWSVAAFYGPLSLAVLVVAILARYVYGTFL